MLTKKLKKNLLIGYIFLSIVGSITIIPLVERVLLQEKSIFNKLYNNIFMGPFNYYGYGVAPQYIINYDFQWHDALNGKQDEFWSQLKTQLKEDFKISSVDMVKTDNQLTVYTSQNLSKYLAKNKSISFVKKKEEYIIKIKKEVIGQWKKQILDGVVNFLKNKYSKSSQVEIVNDSSLKLKIYSHTPIKSIALDKSPITAYGLITSNKEIPSNKTMMIGGSSPFSVYKNKIFDRSMIKSIQWVDYENSHLLKLNINGQGLNNMENLKKYFIDTIIIESDSLDFNQKDFNNGFKPINTDNKSLLGLLRIQKGGGANNFIIQTLWDDNSKILLSNYFNNHTFEGVLIERGIHCYPPTISIKQVKIIYMMVILLILMLAMALFLIFKRYGAIGAIDMVASCALLAFLIRFFDMILDLKLITIFLFSCCVFFLINFWRNYKIKQQNIPLINDTNVMIRKQLYQYLNKVINFYNFIIGTVMTILYFTVPSFQQGVMVFLMTHGVIFLTQNFFWNNWILYYTVQDISYS
jgi:hypothetical protein